MNSQLTPMVGSKTYISIPKWTTLTVRDYNGNMLISSEITQIFQSIPDAQKFIWEIQNVSDLVALLLWRDTSYLDKITQVSDQVEEVISRTWKDMILILTKQGEDDFSFELQEAA